MDGGAGCGECPEVRGWELRESFALEELGEVAWRDVLWSGSVRARWMGRSTDFAVDDVV